MLPNFKKNQSLQKRVNHFKNELITSLKLKNEAFCFIDEVIYFIKEALNLGNEAFSLDDEVITLNHEAFCFFEEAFNLVQEVIYLNGEDILLVDEENYFIYLGNLKNKRNKTCDYLAKLDVYRFKTCEYRVVSGQLIEKSTDGKTLL